MDTMDQEQDFLSWAASDIWLLEGAIASISIEFPRDAASCQGDIGVRPFSPVPPDKLACHGKAVALRAVSRSLWHIASLKLLLWNFTGHPS